MATRYRLFLAVAAVSVVSGFAVAMVPVVGPHPPTIYQPVLGGYWVASRSPGPDWIAGLVVAVIVCLLLLGLMLSARALRAKG